MEFLLDFELQGRRRIVPLTGGTFTGPDMPDGTALGDLRYTLRTDAGEYTFRTSIQVETAAPGLGWLNTGVFIAVGGRRPQGVSYETYLVG